MIFKIYKYATYILEEASVPFAWQTDTLESTLYYIHDRALGILWASQPVLLRDFFKEIGLTDFVVPEENNHYPASFTDNNFEQKYMSFHCEQSPNLRICATQLENVLLCFSLNGTVFANAFLNLKISFTACVQSDTKYKRIFYALLLAFV